MSDAIDKPIQAALDSTTLRPLFGKVLVVLMWLICASALVGLILESDPLAFFRYVALIAFAAYGVWILFWSPSVTITPAGVTVRNLLRSFDVSWPAIERVDTKFALTLFTAARKIVAWSAPQPSRFAAIRTSRAEIRNLPESSYGVGGSIRPGDLPASASGLAALYVRRYWEQLRDAGHLDSGVIEGTGVVTHWLRTESIVLGALLVVGIAAANLVP
ncbi:MAG: PH domain-containing protein [Galbitalea sp.]